MRGGGEKQRFSVQARRDCATEVETVRGGGERFGCGARKTSETGRPPQRKKKLKRGGRGARARGELQETSGECGGDGSGQSVWWPSRLTRRCRKRRSSSFVQRLNRGTAELEGRRALQYGDGTGGCIALETGGAARNRVKKATGRFGGRAYAEKVVGELRKRF